MKLDKSSARWRHLEQKGNSYEKEMDIPTAGSVGRNRQEHFGSCVVCAFRAQRAGGNLAIRGRTGDADLPDRNIDRTASPDGDSLVKQGPFDNE